MEAGEEGDNMDWIFQTVGDWISVVLWTTLGEATVFSGAHIDLPKTFGESRCQQLVNSDKKKTRKRRRLRLVLLAQGDKINRFLLP